MAREGLDDRYPAIKQGYKDFTEERQKIYEDRLKYHLSAVFANNFSNHMFGLAKDILDKDGLDFNVLKPIILSTAKKVQQLDPKSAQTGPAKREDAETIAKHMELLEHGSEMHMLYTILSESIKKHSGWLF